SDWHSLSTHVSTRAAGRPTNRYCCLQLTAFSGPAAKASAMLVSACELGFSPGPPPYPGSFGCLALAIPGLRPTNGFPLSSHSARVQLWRAQTIAAHGSSPKLHVSARQMVGKR